MSNETFESFFLALQDYILLQQNELLQQNREISKKFSDRTSKFDSLLRKSKELSSQVTVAQNTAKVLQEAFKITINKLVQLKRQ